MFLATSLGQAIIFVLLLSCILEGIFVQAATETSFTFDVNSSLESLKSVLTKRMWVGFQNFAKSGNFSDRMSLDHNMVMDISLSLSLSVTYCIFYFSLRYRCFKFVSSITSNIRQLLKKQSFVSLIEI